MNPSEYQRQAERTSSTGTVEGCAEAVDRIGAVEIRLWHGQSGITTELGELTDILKRYTFYGAPMDTVRIEEECGDLLWYVAEVLNAISSDLGRVLETNLRKLKVRYPEKFSSDKALNRDLDAELKALEHTASEPLED